MKSEQELRRKREELERDKQNASLVLESIKQSGSAAMPEAILKAEKDYQYRLALVVMLDWVLE